MGGGSKGKEPEPAVEGPAASTGYAEPEALERVLGEFEDAGLSAYEARVLLALMRLTRANSLQLARLSGVARTSIYPVLQQLESKGAAERLPAEGPAVWACFGHAEVVSRLRALKEEQLRKHTAAMDRLGNLLAEVLPRGPSQTPYVRVIPTAAQTKEVVERLFSGSTEEILAFSKPPYSWAEGKPNPVVVDVLKRGVPTRALYEIGSLEDAQHAAFRGELETYLRAGVEARVADELPVKLVIADRKAALLAMSDQELPDLGYPTNLLFEHPGFATLLAEAFEQRWAEARPYSPSGGEGVRQRASERTHSGRRVPRRPPIPKE